jgi:hypothetical protein
MKKYLLLAACLILAGCSQEAEHQREIISKLDALKTDLAAAGNANTNPSPLRWACANKSDINSVIYQWTAAKTDEARAAEKLSPDVQAKIAAYEALANQMNQMRMSHPALMMVRPMRPGQVPEEPTAEQKEYSDLSKRVEEAKQPVAEIIDRRNRESMQLHEQYSVENIVAEYAKGKYEVVVETGLGSRGVLYSSSGDLVDITQSVISYFKDKQK